MKELLQRTGRLFLLLLAVPAFAGPARDHLSLPGPYAIGDETYHLVWSSHPQPAYYKHEYLPQDETLERFHRMLLIEAMTTASTGEVALSKIDELKARQAIDPFAHYEVQRRPGGEVFIEFLLSAPGADGQTILEWNLYRLRPLGSEGGAWLLGRAERAYGDDIQAFLAALRDRRKPLTDLLLSAPIPAPTLPAD